MYFTKKGLHRLCKELSDLEAEWRVHIARDKRVANIGGGEKGACVALDGLEPAGRALRWRINEKRKEIDNAELAPTPANRDRVAIDTVVTAHVDDGSKQWERVFKVGGYGDNDSMTDPQVFSYDAPSVIALMGLKVGDTVDVELPSGAWVEITVIKIEISMPSVRLAGRHSLRLVANAA